jgi:hypothetical protein
MPRVSLYDFRDTDIMHRLAEVSNEHGVSSQEVAELLGFEAETGGRVVSTRLAWMRRYGMVVFNQETRNWNLSPSGERVIAAQLKAPELRVVEKMPDEKMIEVMALVTSRYQRGEAMLGHMLRREFLYGTKKR